MDDHAMMKYLAALLPLLLLAFALPMGVLDTYGTPVLMRPNVLFVMIDDLNAFPGDVYVDVDTPNIDRVAASGVSFTNAHAAVPICNASRVALITGIGPTTSGILGNGQQAFRLFNPPLATAKTVFRTFQDDGYTIHGTGKIFHQWATTFDQDDIQTPWDSYIDNDGKEDPTTLPGTGLNGIVGTDPNGDTIVVRGGSRIGLDWGPIEEQPVVTDDTSITSDSQRAVWAATQITNAETADDPTFVALGIFKPHLPWFCPFIYTDAMPATVTTPPGISSGDRNDIDNPDENIQFRADWLDLDADGSVNAAQRGYMACVEFADAMLGLALDAVDASDEPWFVVVLGDHGYQLGEKDTWAKMTPWGQASKTTLVMSGPGIAAGSASASPVSLVDIYPTLCDYANVPCPVTLEGTSLRYANDRSIRILTASGGGSTVTSTTYVSRRWTYIVGAVTTEMYDNDADPYQLSNLDYPSISTDDEVIAAKVWLVANAAP
jgi:arylsulfatase A-like enzyme